MTDPIRAVVVEDEPLARRLLRSMLERYDDVELVGEFEDGDAALAGVASLQPDLLFLDVQMPKRTGIELLEALDPDLAVQVVFVTAYDRYALHAFEANAVDFLLKPFDEERLEETLKRVRARLTSGTGLDAMARLQEVLESLQSSASKLERIAVREGERIYLVPVADVQLFEADGKLVHLHLGDRKHSIRQTMTQLEGALDPATFLRISRSAIVNVAAIREIQPWFRGDYVVILANGAKVNTTRAYRSGLKNLIDRP